MSVLNNNVLNNNTIMSVLNNNVSVGSVIWSSVICGGTLHSSTDLVILHSNLPQGGVSV